MIDAIGFADSEKKILLKKYAGDPFNGPFKVFHQWKDQAGVVHIKALPGYKVEDVSALSPDDTPLGILIKMTKAIALSLRNEPLFLEFGDFFLYVNPKEDDIKEKIENYVLRNIKI